MVSVKWPFVFLLLVVACSAQNNCNNKITQANNVVNQPTWICTYQDKKILITGDFELVNGFDDFTEVKVEAEISGWDRDPPGYRKIMTINVDLCSEYDMQWMGKWQQISNYSNIFTNKECLKNKLVKDTKYEISNWPVTAGFMNFWPLGTYKILVTIVGDPADLTLPIFQVEFTFIKSN